MTQTPFTEQITFLYTVDLARTSHFYESVLELPLVLDQGSCHIYRVSSGAYLGFCERTGAKPEGVIITFVTDDVDGWAEQLRNREVTLEKDPAYNPAYGIYHCFFRDPNGYLLEIQRFEDPAWDQSR
ncbi:MAG: VOC family protein [Anaerolineae bacterium]|jgi:catechol 2,3-dioxygenase-like lactoylglutathione lyase family enzyme|nr:VOC family protein [Anaerolineae bacterium]